MRSLLVQLGDSASDLAAMCIESELTIREHCDSLRLKVDIAREIVIENINKDSNTLMSEIDTYERDCLSSWAEAKESTEVTVEDVSKRMRAFLAEQHAYLQSVKSSDDKLTLRFEEANNHSNELSMRKKELKASMFGNKLASFITFTSMAEESLLGELSFTDISLPFNKLDISTSGLKTVDIRTDFDFFLPLEHCERIVAFKYFEKSPETKVTCFDRLMRISRQIHIEPGQVYRSNAAQCGPNEFVVCHFKDYAKLIVYDSDLHCLRKVRCKYFSQICCYSKFVFGYFDMCDSNFSDSDDDGKDDEQEEYLLGKNSSASLGHAEQSVLSTCDG